MGVVDINEKPITNKITSNVNNTVSKLVQAKNFVDSLNNLFGSIERIASPFIQKYQQNQQIYKQTTPLEQEKAMEESIPMPGNTTSQSSKKPVKNQNNNLSQNDMINFFSTPQGLKTIAGAIQTFKNHFGDVKLSEVEDLINTIMPNQKLQLYDLNNNKNKQIKEKNVKKQKN